MNNDLLNNVVNTIQGGKSIETINQQDDLVRKTTVEATNSLFEELLVIYPSYLAMIKKNSPEDAKRLYNKTKKMWLDTLIEENITPQMVQLGLSKCRKSSTGFMPTIGEFVSWCHPSEEDLGIPTVESAYIEACQHTRGKKPEDYSHVIVYEAGSKTGFFELAGSSSSKMRPIFKTNYNQLKDKLIRGEEITVLNNALEDRTSDNYDPRSPEQKEQDRKEVAKKYLDQLMGRC